MPTRRIRLAFALVAGLALASSQALIASAHVVESAGSYHLEIGWHLEPAYSGQPNAIELTISDASEKPVTDLGPDDLHATVSTANQTSSDLAFEPAFDLAEGNGTPGQYIARIEPTAPGDYTFAIKGTIHATAVDVSVTSSDTTFDPVVGTADIQFPTKLPTEAEVATHLDRLDGRVAQAGATADSANTTATQAIIVGGVLGGAGLVVALVALVMAWRARKGSAASA
jgi:hypothetical protein